MRKSIRPYTSDPSYVDAPPRVDAHTRALPHDAGASLPLVQRYTDHRFREVSKKRLRYARDELQAEVAALLRAVPLDFAAAIFHWTWSSKQYAKGELQDKFIEDPLVQHYHQKNMEVLGVDQVLALLQAAREGGWTKSGNRPVPEIVRLAMRAARDDGATVQQIADRFGFGYHTASYAMRVPHEQRMARKRVGLVL